MGVGGSYGIIKISYYYLLHTDFTKSQDTRSSALPGIESPGTTATREGVTMETDMLVHESVENSQLPMGKDFFQCYTYYWN